MRDQITALESLQQVDLKLRTLEENIQKYPKEISRYNNELASLEESITATKQELSKTIAQKVNIELKLSSNQEGVKKSEKKLFEIKTYKEYEALQKEIAELKKSNIEIEDQILKEMEKIDKLEKQLKSTQDSLAQKQEEYGSIISDYEKKMEALKHDYAIKNQEKEKIASLVNNDVLSMYERIRRKTGIALVPTKNQVCTGCNMNLPPQLFNEVLRLSRMVQCPSCHRILYCEETRDGELQRA